MATLHHHPFCPHSRFVRLVLGELGVGASLIEQRPWEHRHEFLTLNPAGTTPVLVEEQGFAVPGAGTIAEYVDETRGLGVTGPRLLPEDVAGRVEVRRLVDWFNTKFFEEVTSPLVTEKIYKRFMSADVGGGPPNMSAIRAARTNVRYHLRYIGFLLGRRNCLAGDTITYADLAAAAHLSCVDYLGDVPWSEDETAKAWYARMKSRPSFRSILSDTVAGMAPAAQYADLDF